MHLNQVLARDDYNQAMQNLYDAVAKMMEEYSGVRDTQEYWTQDIINGCELVIIDGLNQWKDKQDIDRTL
jgi:hypothetical protein